MTLLGAKKLGDTYISISEQYVDCTCIGDAASKLTEEDITYLGELYVPHKIVGTL